MVLTWRLAVGPAVGWKVAFVKMVRLPGQVAIIIMTKVVDRQAALGGKRVIVWICNILTHQYVLLILT